MWVDDRVGWVSEWNGFDHEGEVTGPERFGSLSYIDEEPPRSFHPVRFEPEDVTAFLSEVFCECWELKVLKAKEAERTCATGQTEFSWT